MLQASDAKTLGSMSEVLLDHARACLSNFVHLSNADPKTRKRLPNIHFTSEVDQNRSKYSPRPLLQGSEKFWTPG